MTTPDSDHARRGGAPVAALDQLPGREARAVGWLREWCEGPDGQTRVWQDAVGRLGAARARACLSAFEQLLGLILAHGRRPLMRHSTGCTCVGADEAVFAQFLTSAATGEAEDAMMLASLLVRADMAPTVYGLARTAGLGLLAGRAAAPAMAANVTWPATAMRH
ncbi:MAG: hypothetical protein HUJ24_11870 [Rhodobacteraceae bacterium]|nr:hypothetical protein [Paracoccaceae bacterium]